MVSLNKFFTLSIAFHLSAVVVFFLVTSIKSSSEKQRFLNAQLLKNSIKVDMVGMPTLTKKELESLPEITSSKKVTDSKEVPIAEKEVKEKVEVTSKKAASKGKDVIKLKKNKDKSKKGKLSKSLSKELSELTILGNQISKGQSATGEISDEELSELSEYVSKVKEKVKRNWSLPTFLLKKDLKCQVILFIGSQGNLIRSSLLETSGESEYDLRAIGAIDQSAPFEAPNPSIQDNLKSGIVLLFPF
jgi:hypothetical protein